MSITFLKKSLQFIFISTILTILQAQLRADDKGPENQQPIHLSIRRLYDPNDNADHSIVMKEFEKYGLGVLPNFPHFGNHIGQWMYIISKGESKKTDDQEVLFTTNFNASSFNLVQTSVHSFVLDKKPYVLITVYSPELGVLLASVFENPQKNLGKVSEYQKVKVSDIRRTIYPLDDYPVKSKLNLKPVKPISEVLIRRELFQTLDYKVKVDANKNILNLYETKKGKQTLLATYDHLKNKKENWTVVDKTPIKKGLDLKARFSETEIK